MRRGSARERGYDRVWAKSSKAFLSENPFCLGCSAVGLVVPATLTDHTVPHKGDSVLFWDRSNWQPSCDWHHNVVKQRLERLWVEGRVRDAALSLDSEAAQTLTRQLGGHGL